MKRKFLQPKTCFALGIAGAVCSLAAAVLMALSFGQAIYLRNAALAFTGIMLLFLALTEKGKENRGRRLKMLLLFFALVLSYPNLPLLCPLLEGIVLPLFCLLYKKQGDGVPILLLSVLEVVYFVVRSAAIVDAFAPYTPQVMGISLGLLAVARGFMLIRFYREAAKQAPLMVENIGGRIR